MVAQPVVWVDVESAVRAWARDAVTSASRRVFFGRNNDLTGNQVVLHRVGGSDDRCLIQFDCWSSTKAGSASLAAELATEADALTRYEDDGVILHAAAVDAVRWLPDFESDSPRHIVDVTFVASAAPAGS
jgi:hypothetical protein